MFRGAGGKVTPELFVSVNNYECNWPHSIDFRCQTYEGGFSGTPGMEAHGGYTFCGLAALTLLHAHHLCDTPALLVSVLIYL